MALNFTQMDKEGSTLSSKSHLLQLWSHNVLIQPPCHTVLTGSRYNMIPVFRWKGKIASSDCNWCRLSAVKCAPLLTLTVSSESTHLSLAPMLFACGPDMTTTLLAFCVEYYWWCSDWLKLLWWFAAQNTLFYCILNRMWKTVGTTRQDEHCASCITLTDVRNFASVTISICQHILTQLEAQPKLPDDLPWNAECNKVHIMNCTHFHTFIRMPMYSHVKKLLSTNRSPLLQPTRL